MRRSMGTGVVAVVDLLVWWAAGAVAEPTTGEAVRFGLVLAGVLLVTGSYRRRVNLSALGEVPSLVSCAAVSLLLLAVADLVTRPTLGVSGALSSAVVVMAGAAAVLLPLGRSASYVAIRALRRRRIVRDPVLVIGADRIGTMLARSLELHSEHGMDPIGFVDDIDPAGAPAPLLGELAALDDVLAHQSVRRVIIAFGSRREDDLVRVLRTTLRRDVDVYVVPRLHEFGLDAGHRHVETVGCIPLQRLRPAAPTLWTWPAKRAFDIAVAAGVLIVLSPLLAAMAIGVRLSGPGSVLFRQLRVGQHGRTFELLKFRSLPPNDDADVRWTVADDTRQTRLGTAMRRFSLDELPQLWNVVRGDMSLIGPRPERPHFVEQFSSAVAGYDQRHRLPVGLTGWAQVNGLRGDTSIADRARFDNHYIDHWSLLNDLTILVATVAAVVRDGRARSSV